MKQKIKIKENSLIAKLGAKLLKVDCVALTIGNTIYLHNATKQDLLKTKTWLAHELIHVKQYKQKGKLLFLMQYCYEWMLKGYRNISFEIEARAKENYIEIINDFEF